MKKLLLLLMLMPMAALSLHSATFTYQGLIYEIISETKKTVSVSSYNSAPGNVVIPEKVIGYSVTSIGEQAFSGCSSLTSVTISNSVTTIGEGAFADCSSLTSVTIGNSVTSIGSAAFYYCKRLTSITIPNSVTSIGASAFQECTRLSSVTIGNSVTSIGYLAFGLCTGLTSLTIGNSVTSIGIQAFYNCTGLTSVTIPDSVISIGNFAFSSCTGLTILTIGNSVTSIGEGAFYKCSGLTSVTIPNSVTSIGFGAFQECTGLSSLTIGNSVTSIERQAFYNCTGLTSVTIPAEVNSIGEYAFSECSLDEIKLQNPTPPSFYQAFNSYASMAVLIIPDNTITSYLDSDWNNFLLIEEESGLKTYLENDGVFKYRFLEGFEEAWLVQDNDYSNMTSASIPDRVVGMKNGSEIFYSVTRISVNAFSGCTKLSQVKLPAKCTVIDKEAFKGCDKLTEISIPNTVTSIGSNAFSGCENIRKVTISDLASWASIDFGRGEDNDDDSNNLYASNPLSYSHSLYLNGEEIKDLVLPDGLNSIKAGAFYGGNCIKSVSIPTHIATIGDNAFEAIEFDRIRIEEGIESITWNGTNNINVKDLYVGRNMVGQIRFSSLQNLEFGGYVEKIEASRYNNNPTLTSVEINPGSGVVIYDNAFTNCSNLKELTLPGDVAEIGKNAFSGTALADLTIPSGVIGDNAFSGCNLQNIILGADVVSMGEKAFDGSNAIKNVYSTPTTPPSAQNNTFSYYEAQLFVPAESIDIYYNTPRCWYRFSGKALVLPEKIVMEGPTEFTGEPGETLQLSATILPSNVTLDRIVWSSTNPAVATVDNNGLVTMHNFRDSDRFKAAGSNGYCEIIASSLYENSPIAVVSIELLTGAIEYVEFEGFNSGTINGRYANDIYTLQGVCLKRQASQEDIDALEPGIYIVGGKKVLVR